MQDEVDEGIPYIKAEKINKKVDSWLSSYTAGGRGKPFFLWIQKSVIERKQ